MEFKEKIFAGFKVIEFEDDYGVKCSLQESSSIVPHVWLGVNDGNPQILCRDAERLGLELPAETNYLMGEPVGWCKYKIPEEVLLTTRMHLNSEQALALGKKLIKFAKKKIL